MSVVTETRPARNLAFESAEFNERIGELLQVPSGSTEPIGHVQVEFLERSVLPTSAGELLVSPYDSTEAEGSLAEHSGGKPNALQSLVGAVVLAFRPLAEPESSLTINPFWMAVASRLEQEDEAELAEFFEPISFSWNADINRVRNIAREYSQQTHADY
jgi:hypothetical protein